MGGARGGRRSRTRAIGAGSATAWTTSSCSRWRPCWPASAILWRSAMGFTIWTPRRAVASGVRAGADTYQGPSEPTLRRVLQPVDPEAVDAVFRAWLDAETRQAGDALAIDGKSLRGSAHGARTRPVHLLAGIVHRTGHSSGQGTST